MSKYPGPDIPPPSYEPPTEASPSSSMPVPPTPATADEKSYGKAVQPQQPLLQPEFAGYSTLRHGPIQMVCPYCGVNVVTEIHHKVGVVAGVGALLTGFVFLPLFWVPLVMKSCKDTVHACPNCHRFLGRVGALQ
ncbi:hypothetical protein IWQ62_004740 [Dispira parvispora]|uniref:LITAF domain-containing protein n=1 Tax=Dispira parvispora TaxID=1520584 RepID=A0A9W8ALB6_9FUNG|nr:hypothetical protein IWQ62_004740 [Dispira parvispora]